MQGKPPMQVAFHLGAHCTDDDRLVRSLLKSRGTLAARGVQVPAPGRFRPVLREALKALRGAEASAAMQATLLDAILDEDAPERLVLCSESFLCAPRKAVEGGALYPIAGRKAAWFPALFPDAETALFFALRNPAAFVPALSARLGDDDRMVLPDASGARALSWLPVVQALRDATPDVPVTVWCDEDSALLWPEIMAAVAGLDEDVALEGGRDRLRQVMTADGADRLDAYLAANPPGSPEIRRRVEAAFLERYAEPGAMETELDLPDWTAELVDDLTEAYDADCYRIARMDGVRFLQP